MDREVSRGRYRRRFIQGAIGTIGLLAGCLGGPEAEPIAERYRTASSRSGLARNPGQLQSQAAANYRNEPGTAGRNCAGCTYYIPAMGTDDRGACTIVAGRIDPNGYCPLYVPYQGGENGSATPSGAGTDSS